MKYTINVMLIAIVVLFSSFNSNKEKLSTAILESELPITITSPAGGQDYCLNEQQNIVWQTTGGVVTTVSIFLMESNGQTIHRTIATDVPNSGQYLWNRDASAEGNFLIKITGKSEMSEDVITGQTGVFALKDCRKPDLRVGMMGAKAIGSGIIAEGQRILYIGEVVNSGETTVQNPTVKMMLDRPGNQPSSQITVELDATIVKNGKANFEKAFRVHKPGTYTVTLILDPEDALDEMDEMNNSRTRSFNVPPLPDLIVYISNGKRPPVGREREIRIVVKNIGSVATNSYGNWNLRSYVKQKGVKNYDIPPLAPGETHTIKRKHKWGTAGTKKVNARISTTHTELNADNNFVEGSFFVRLPHHDMYSGARPIKCSTGETFSNWEEIEN
jgi:hypothetical protein